MKIPNNKHSVLSLQPQCLGDWIFKVSVNSLDEGILIFALHPVTRLSFLKSFFTPDDAKVWVNKISKLSGTVDVSDI